MGYYTKHSYLRGRTKITINRTHRGRLDLAKFLSMQFTNYFGAYEGWNMVSFYKLAITQLHHGKEYISTPLHR